MNLTIAAQTISQPIKVAAGALVTVTPAAGAIAAVEYTTGDEAAVRNNVAVWSPWAKGAVRAKATDQLNDTGFIRVMATGGTVAIAVDATPTNGALAPMRADWGVTATVMTDASGNPTALLGANGDPLYPLPAPGDSILTRYGVTAFDVCREPGLGNTMLIGQTDIASHGPSNERPRFSTYTRKVVMGNSGSSQIRFVQMNAFDPDPVEKAFSIDIYIETLPNEFAGTGLTPYIDVEISSSSGTSATNISRWSFGAQYLRQGWNTLKLRAADTVTTTAGGGNLATGSTHPADVGTGFDWNAGGMRYLAMRFANMQGQTVHIDQIRKPAKAKPVVVLGFDASGSSGTDPTFVIKVAPLFKKYGVRGYVTCTNIYEMIYSGSFAWKRITDLYNNYGWDVINHTWSHGATEVGRNTTVASLTVNGSNVATVGFTSPHAITPGTTFRAVIKGSSIAQTNGIFEMVAVNANDVRYTAPGAAAGTATGTIILNTFLSEVFNTDTPENRRLWRHEVADMSNTMRSVGFARAAAFLAYPNNLAPELNVLQYGCTEAGIKIGRGYHAGYTLVNEFGIDNPLHIGCFEMGSGATASTTSEIETKVRAAIDRGEHIQVYGHFILDDTNPANAAYAPLPANGDEYPPGANGNPNPPAAGVTGTGGWWYFSQLKRLMDGTIGPAIARGELMVMSPSEYLAFMGYTK